MRIAADHAVKANRIRLNRVPFVVNKVAMYQLKTFSQARTPIQLFGDIEIALREVDESYPGGTSTHQLVPEHADPAPDLQHTLSNRSPFCRLGQQQVGGRVGSATLESREIGFGVPGTEMFCRSILTVTAGQCPTSFTAAGRGNSIDP